MTGRAHGGGTIGRILGRPMVWAIRVYQYVLSPVLPMACRFQPTCSSYAVEAIGRHGPLVGGWLALRRIARCHPWGGQGYDPVPPRGQAATGNACDKTIG